MAERRRFKWIRFMLCRNESQPMDRLSALELFVRVVEAGSFSAAARERRLSQPAASKQVAALERSLGVRLLHRSTRKVRPTDEGLAYYEQAREAVQTLREAGAAVRLRDAGLGGTLHVATSVGFGRVSVAPLVAGFLAAHPRLAIELHMADAYVDLVREGIDVAIRVGELRDEGLIARRIGTSERVVVAAPAYLERAGEPVSPSDLAAHNCIIYSGLAAADHWPFETDDGVETVSVRGNLRCSSGEGVLGAVLAGAGITCAPLWQVGPEIAARRLKRLLPRHRPRPLPIHAVWPTSRRLSPRVKVFVDHLEDCFARCPWVAGFGLPRLRGRGRPEPSDPPRFPAPPGEPPDQQNA
jgi:DNA-binding transcriptional LysR family regulator